MSNQSQRKLFKEYDQDQLMLLPPSFDELIDANHPVRVVNSVIDGIDLGPLLSNYKGGGSTSFHPRMMLKVLVYSYLNNTYSSRSIERGLQENIHHMWLARMQKPDHNTINRFRTGKLLPVFKGVFTEVGRLLIEQGVVSLEKAFIDGTKIEANANRYTFRWKRAIDRSKEKIKEQLQDPSPTTFEKIDPQSVREAIDRIKERIGGRPVEKKVSQKLKYAEKNWPPKLVEYERTEPLFKGRNSFSKTDVDATFMRMKEDHMRNGQLKPGYNVQVSTENQYILDYTVHPDRSDSTTLPAHLESLERTCGKLPGDIVADAGYGSEENYALMEAKGSEAYVKHTHFDNRKKRKKNVFLPESMEYDAAGDFYTCPAGRRLMPAGQKERQTASGYKTVATVYQSEGCAGCLMRERCHKAKDDRRIEVSAKMREYRKKADQRLESEKGTALRKQRGHDVESVFGNIKQNKGFRRFSLRGQAKVELEFGLVALAQNLRKLAG
jgi:transposase